MLSVSHYVWGPCSCKEMQFHVLFFKFLKSWSSLSWWWPVVSMWFLNWCLFKLDFFKKKTDLKRKRHENSLCTQYHVNTEDSITIFPPKATGGLSQYSYILQICPQVDVLSTQENTPPLQKFFGFCIVSSAMRTNPLSPPQNIVWTERATRSQRFKWQALECRLKHLVPFLIPQKKIRHSCTADFCSKRMGKGSSTACFSSAAACLEQSGSREKNHSQTHTCPAHPAQLASLIW